MTTMDQSGQGTPSNVMPTEDGQQTDAPTAWLIRAGRKGQRYDYNIEHGLVGLGFGRVPDLRGFSSRQELADTLRLRSPDDTDGSISNRAGKLWRLRTDVRVGDLVVMPRMAEQIALGTVTREYWYDDSDPDADLPHVVSVEWERADMSRAAVKEDLLRSLPPRGTISAITRNDAPWRLQQLLETGRDPGARVESDDGIPEVSILVEQFRVESGYPTGAHVEQERLRTEWAEKLAPENIAHFSRHDLTAVASHGTWNRAMYVYPNPRGVLQWIGNLHDDEYSRLLDHIQYLCWDHDELWLRYDQLTDSRSDRKVRGLKNETTSRLLAICHPKDFLPIGTHDGRWSRKTMLHRLGLPEPRGSSHGQRVADANNRLRDHLEPYFHHDLLAMGAFLEWLLQQEPPDSPRDLAELADELLIEGEFLEDIVSLLDDKGQVIL